MLLSHRRTVIAGVGSSIPEKVVPNDHFLDFDFYMDYDRPVDPATNPNVIDKFHQITDISERRYATDDQVASDLAAEAGAAAIEAAVAAVLEEGEVTTRDIGGTATTDEVGSAVAERI